MEYNVIDLKQYDIVRYLKCIYLVKDFAKDENGKYILNYHFRTIYNSNAELYSENTYELYGFHAEKIRKATKDEIRYFISRIKKEKPDFDLNYVEDVSLDKPDKNINEKECIDFLKSKGYLVYKQI
ncbi:hypothetical protein [Labilibaculum euxinus]